MWADIKKIKIDLNWLPKINLIDGIKKTINSETEIGKKKIVKQAVILCGGLGTRLKPYTKHTPKPMVKINGRPFLHYLLDQLSDQGIKQFLLLTGYLGEKIIDYFGDGSSYGWLIEYSKGEIEWDTGKRLYKAQCQIKDEFLLLYSDNFIQFNLAKLVKKYQENKSLITFAPLI